MRPWIALAAANGCLAVVAGAWGYHRLPETEMAGYAPIFEIAVRYHMWHALALLGVGWLADRAPKSRLVPAAGAAFQGGIVLFCGTLYGLVLTARPPVAGIAPAGGLLLMGGWLLLLAFALRRTPR